MEWGNKPTDANEKRNEKNNPSRLILYAGGEDYLFITLQIHLHKPLSSRNFFCFLFIHLTCADTWYSNSMCDLPSNFSSLVSEDEYIVDWELRQFKLCRLFPFAGFHYRRAADERPRIPVYFKHEKQGFHVTTKISS